MRGSTLEVLMLHDQRLQSILNVMFLVDSFGHDLEDVNSLGFVFLVKRILHQILNVQIKSLNK